MDKQAIIRRVRIAVSVFFGVMTVALCVLWVRSYWRLDFVSRIYSHRTTLYSNNGYLQLEHASINLPPPSNPWGAGVGHRGD